MGEQDWFFRPELSVMDREPGNQSSCDPQNALPSTSVHLSPLGVHAFRGIRFAWEAIHGRR